MNKLKQKWFELFIERKILAGLLISGFIIVILSIFLFQDKTKMYQAINDAEIIFNERTQINKSYVAFQELKLTAHRFLITRNRQDSLKFTVNVFALKNILLNLEPKIKEHPELLKPYSFLLSSIDNYSNDIIDLYNSHLASDKIYKRIYEIEGKYNKESDIYFLQLNDANDKSGLGKINELYSERNKEMTYVYIFLITSLFILSILFIHIAYNMKLKKKISSEIANQRNELNAIINAVPAIIYVRDLDGNIKILNNNYEVNNIDNINIHDQNYRQIFNTPENELAEEEYSAVIKNKKTIKDIERQFFFNDGSSKWFHVNKAPLVDDKDNVIGLVGVMNDITEKILSRESLIAAHKQLQISNQQKDKLFSIIAHDLRSPFIGMVGFAEILSDDYDQLSDEERKFYIDNINISLSSLLLLLDSLLSWARLNLNRYEYKPKEIDLRDIIHNVFSCHHLAASGKKIYLRSNNVDGVKVFADPDMVEVIIRNLVANSIKFTNDEGTINISACEEEQYIKICVQDNGVGMNQETMDNLFTSNEYRTTPGTNNEKGTGLGLRTCKELIEKNSGTISVKSKIGEGTEFSFTLLKYIPNQMN